MDWGGLLKGGMNAISGMFGGQQPGAPSWLGAPSSTGGFGNTGGGMSSSGGQGGGGFGSMFGKPNLAGGLAGIFGSQLIGNPKQPQLPQSLMNFQQQALSGGSPLQQQANQYNSTLLSGQNTSANDAATHSLDLNYQEQLRQLNGMYKSLRPGTDPTSDTTYQRDLSNLNDQYTRQKAQTLAQQQQGAAQYGLQSGAESANQQLAAIQPQLQQTAQDWAANYQKQATLRNSLMSLFGNQATGGMYGLGNMFQNMFKNQGQ